MQLFERITLGKTWAARLVLVFFFFAQLPLARAGLAQGEDPIPSPILDPDSVSWASVRNKTSAQFEDYFDEKADAGYMVLDIEVAEINDVQRVGAVWQKNTDGRGWYEYRTMTASEFQDKLDELSLKGFRLIDQEAYRLDGTRYFAGVWIKNQESLGWITYLDKTDAEFSTLYDRYSGAGYLMIDIDVYQLGSELRYAAVWVANSEGLAWQEWRDMTSSEYSDKFDQLKDEYRMIDIESYEFGGVQYYAGIWVENVNGRAWQEWHNMTSTEFGNKWLRLRDAGYRLIDYEVYETEDGWRYAGIWRQNSDRPDWALKDEVDDLGLEEMDDSDVPGMSIAIAENNKLVYLRGFGYADIDDEVIAHSGTIFRLASVSKAVGGTLALELSEQGLFDLNLDSLDYVPVWPDFHTHTVSQTISNRSGIGHYNEYPDIEDNYSSALEASGELMDTSLFAPPGTTYKYSTHAYTFLGASMEMAVGDVIRELVDDYIRYPYNLPTLRQENPNVDIKDRATLYDQDNDEISRDDQSWKVLGGGLESSAYDLVRFGVKLTNGTILSQASLDLMWNAPDMLNNYALGWNTGTEAGTPVVAKAGANSGAKSYIRIYPDKGIVIVVLTNRKNGGHDPTALAKAIGALMLAQIPLAEQEPAGASSPNLLDEIEEPGEEATDPALEILPVETPASTPTYQDKWEVEDNQPIVGAQIYLPVIQR